MAYNTKRFTPDEIAEIQRQRDMDIRLKAQEQQYDPFTQAQMAARPGVQLYRQSDAERRAGVEAPRYEGSRDIKTGELLKQFKFDPYQGEAMQALKQQAFATGDSPWARMQLDKLKMEQGQGMDQAVRQQLQARAQGQAALASGGGLSSGARERMARMGSRDLMMAKQGIARQGIAGRMGIQGQDIDRKQGLLSDFGNAEREAQKMGIDALQQDINRKSMFDSNRYNQLMQTFAAEKSASAQSQAAAKSGGGGSFICTALDEHGLLTDEEAEKMFALVKVGFFPRADFGYWYFSVGYYAVKAAMRHPDVDWNIVKMITVTDILDVEKRDGKEAAVDAYIRAAGTFGKDFLGKDCVDDKMFHASWLRSLMYLPLVLTHPRFVKWYGGFLKRKVSRFGKKMLCKLKGAVAFG